MPQYQFLYDAAEKAYVEQELLPLLGELAAGHSAFAAEEPETWASDLPLLLYLNDGQLRFLLPKLAKAQQLTALLPHPKGQEAAKAMGMLVSMERARKHLEQKHEPIRSDLLFCNGRLVLNKVVLGQLFSLNANGEKEHSGFWAGLFAPLLRFIRLRSFLVSFELPDEKPFRTAVTGLVVSEHQNSSLLSRLFEANKALQGDGLLHAYAISPRSVLETLLYWLRSTWDRKKLLPFAGTLSSKKLSLQFPHGEREYLFDNEQLLAKQLDFEIGEESLLLIPGFAAQASATDKAGSESRKLQNLPRGEAAEALAEYRLPFFRQASTEEFKELFQVLRSNAQPKSSYLVLMVLSTLLAALGLFANSSPVIIGAMILAPLMAPIISLSMGVLRQDKTLILGSAKTIVYGILLSMFFALLLTWLTPLRSPSEELLARTRPHILDLGVAVLSGIAGAYAYAREEVAKTLAGVAIAVALVPPMTTAAIGLAWWNMPIFLGAALLLFTNLAGMLFAAGLSFFVLGFSPIKFAGKSLAFSLSLVLLLSVPLFWSFQAILREHNIVRALQDVQVDDILFRDVQVRSLSPLRMSIKLVSEHPLTEQELTELKTEIQKRIGKTQEDVQIEFLNAVLW